MDEVIIYTDGSCLGNPGPGGWAAILSLANTAHRREFSGGCRITTNNRMELMAAIQGLSALTRPCSVLLYSDSRYLCDSINKGWLNNWHRRDWVKADKKPVLNIDLWKELLPLLSMHRVQLEWLRGHAGHPENERCDELARSMAQMNNLPPDLEFENSSSKSSLQGKTAKSNNNS